MRNPAAAVSLAGWAFWMAIGAVFIPLARFRVVATAFACGLAGFAFGPLGGDGAETAGAPAGSEAPITGKSTHRPGIAESR